MTPIDRAAELAAIREKQLEQISESANRVYSKCASGLCLTPAEVVQLSAGAQYPHANVLAQAPGMFRNWRGAVRFCLRVIIFALAAWGLVCLVLLF